MELDIIKNQTTWNDAVASLNNNFSKVRLALAMGGSGGGSFEVREFYPTKVIGLIDEDYDITAEERAYNIETLSKVAEGKTILLKAEHAILLPSVAIIGESYSETQFSLVVDLFGTPYSYTATITSNGDAVLEMKELSTGGGGSIDPELLEGYMPLVRDFSDDFNNDFTR